MCAPLVSAVDPRCDQPNGLAVSRNCEESPGFCARESAERNIVAIEPALPPTIWLQRVAELVVDLACREHKIEWRIEWVPRPRNEVIHLS